MILYVLLFQGTPVIEPTDLELQKIGAIVQTGGKVKELVETLEMSYILGVLANNPTPAYAVLFNWSREMKMRKYPNIRLHLVHHLATIGMYDVAYRYA